MRSLEEILEEAGREGIKLSFSRPSEIERPEEILFDVPLVAMSLLVMARGARKPIRTATASVRVAHMLVAAFLGLRKIADQLEWSIALRRSVADAFIFLEQLGLVSVEDASKYRLTPTGIGFLNSASRDDTETALLMRGLIRARTSLRVADRAH